MSDLSVEIDTHASYDSKDKNQKGNVLCMQSTEYFNRGRVFLFIKIYNYHSDESHKDNEVFRIHVSNIRDFLDNIDSFQYNNSPNPNYSFETSVSIDDLKILDDCMICSGSVERNFMSVPSYEEFENVYVGENFFNTIHKGCLRELEIMIRKCMTRNQDIIDKDFIYSI